MNATIELLDAYKKALPVTSDNAAAMHLGVTRAAVSSWRTGLKHPAMNTVEKMAEAIHQNPAKWAMRIEAERAKNAADRKAWLRCAQQVAVVALALTASMAALPHRANAATIAATNATARSLSIV